MLMCTDENARCWAKVEPTHNWPTMHFFIFIAVWIRTQHDVWSEHSSTTDRASQKKAVCKILAFDRVQETPPNLCISSSLLHSLSPLSTCVSLLVSLSSFCPERQEGPPLTCTPPTKTQQHSSLHPCLDSFVLNSAYINAIWLAQINSRKKKERKNTLELSVYKKMHTHNIHNRFNTSHPQCC